MKVDIDNPTRIMAKHALASLLGGLVHFKDLCMLADDPEVRAISPLFFDMVAEQCTAIYNYMVGVEAELDRDKHSAVEFNTLQNVLAMIWTAATDRKYEDGVTLPVEVLNAVVAMRSTPDSKLLDLLESGLYMHTEDIKTESLGWVRGWVAAFDRGDGLRITVEASTVRALLRTVIVAREKYESDRSSKESVVQSQSAG